MFKTLPTHSNEKEKEGDKKQCQPRLKPVVIASDVTRRLHAAANTVTSIVVKQPLESESEKQQPNYPHNTTNKELTFP
ncbi:hypothetical protein [Pseudomonas sp. ACN8]|uniref:hypothetical protein n=1 Tax=Pseudomonas sp. ACN8 TaxID=1920428 RepID=UPI00114482BC|nr:hypothetical protein [Pseudomonas sp. ACN8]